jgi:hypothetical protein
MKVLAVLIALLFSFPNLSAAQQAAAPAPASSTQATTLLTEAVAALAGRVALTDVTLSGPAHRIAGSDDESGTSVMKALATGEVRVDLVFPSGPRSEVVSLSNKCLAGSWSGPDGVAHPSSNHNLMTDSSWFFPAFTVSRIMTPRKYVLSYVGHETQNGQAVEHVTAYQPSTVPLPAGVATFSHLTQMDLFLDSSTLLPVTLAFNIHPDNNANLDIPVQILFSDYRPVNGAQIPFHVQKFINNNLALDLQFTSAVLNSGLSASSFTVGAGL